MSQDKDTVILVGTLLLKPDTKINNMVIDERYRKVSIDAKQVSIG